MKNLKVSQKLIVSFIIVLILAIMVGLVGIFGMYSINKADDGLYSENVVALSAMGQIRETLQDQRVQMRNCIIDSGNSSRIQEHQNNMAELNENMLKYFAEYEKTITDRDAEKSYFEAVELYKGEFTAFKEEVREKSLEDFDAAYKALFADHSAAMVNQMVTAFDESMTSNDAWARAASEKNTALFITMLIVEVVVLVAAAIIALFFAFYISGLISKPLNLLASFMKKAGTTGDLALNEVDKQTIGKYALIRDEIGQTISAAAAFVDHVTKTSKSLEVIAGGDLTVEAVTLSDMDTMGISLKTMLSNLNNMFGEINSSTDQVSAGSKQIADGAQALAAGSTEQASSVEELAAALSEISEKTNQNADMAKEAADLSATIKVSAEKGDRQMDQMMQAVTEINEASGSISKVIKVIDDIAFQTNILALNAAVEAARAGQHGKGFAVVAEEVRNLAAKSAEAAKDTSGLIENSIEKANLGMTIATETSESLKEIVAGINHNAEIIGKIEESSKEQSTEIHHVNAGIDQVAQVVQQNSATAEESAAASEEMSGQAGLLQQLIAQFKLKDHRGFGVQTQSKPKAAPKFEAPAPAYTGRPDDFGGDDFSFGNDKY